MQPDPQPGAYDSTKPLSPPPAGGPPSRDRSETVPLSPPWACKRGRPADEVPPRIEHYEVIEPLGRGGMGEVYLAWDPVLSRRIALKRIRPDMRSEREPRDRFSVEACVTAMLQHPSIIPVYSFASERDELFYTMRPVEGKTLAEILERLRAGDRGAREEWTVLHLVRLFLQATGAVAFAHSKGVVHRDLKPANIMIGPFEEVLVLDWGLAKILDQPDDGAEPVVEPAALAAMDIETATRTIVGTPGYIPIEQLERGVPSSPQSDVFALGVILYELLALWPAWTAPDIGSLVEEMKKTPRNPASVQPGREIPAALADVALRAIHPDPARRYPSVTGFAHDVADALEGRASWQPIEQAGEEQIWRLYEGRLVEGDEALTFQSRGRNQEFVYVYPRPLFTNDLRLEFEFSFRKGAHSLSVVLNGADLRDRAELAGYSVGVVSRRRRTISLVRNGRDVAGSKSPDYEPKRWYRVTVERNLDHLSLRVNDEAIYGYTDPIPLRGGYVALLGASMGLQIRNLRLWSSGASSTVSCLSVPDAFFNRTLYEEARSEYLRIASSLPGRREGRLAGFRAGLCYVEMARQEDDPEVRELLLQEAEQSFVSLRRLSRSCLAGLGRAIAESERAAHALVREALSDALTEYPDDPHENAVREWLLSYLHGAGEADRHAVAECLPLAVEHCRDASGTRVVRELIQRVRTSWEIPSFLAGRLQGKVADDAFRAEIRLFFGFWSARPEEIDEAAGALLASDRPRGHHVTDAVFALLELGRVDQANAVLGLFERPRPLAEEAERFEVARGLSRAAVLAVRGDLAEAERLLAALDCGPTDRSYNTARLMLARAAYRAGRQGQIFKTLRAVDRHDSFAREHRAWFFIKLDETRQATRELAPLIDRGSHERGRNLTNFLHGLCLLREGREADAGRVFGLLPFPRYPRTWTLGSHQASGRLAGARLDRYLEESFLWERRQLFSQMALLARVRGDEGGFRELLDRSQRETVL